ncbi:MAG: hypothetical protein PQJ59_17285 [Spirochaetales bacterium]|nr:hypothetical protein [Spirochaetales bacterium]
MRLLLTVFFFSLSTLIFAQISSHPSAQLLVDQGLEELQEGEFEAALQHFLQARELDGENAIIESYITSLSRMVTLDALEADPEEIDRFIEEQEVYLDREEEQIIVEDEGEKDFITQEIIKEQARLDRSRGELFISYPLLNSSSGDGELDSNLRTEGNFLEGMNYNLSFYPEVFNRTIGIEGGFGSFSMEYDDVDMLYDELHLGITLRNYFNEKPGSYSLLGTHMQWGVVFEEDLSTDDRSLLSHFRFEAFINDPTLYRLIRNSVTQRVSFTGKLQFSLFDETYMLAYGGGLLVNAGNKLDFFSDFIYRNYLVDDVYYPSWTAFLGMQYLIR